MNAEEFYQAFKSALDALDVLWGNKDLVQVEIKNNCIRFTYRHMSVEVRQPE